MPQRTVALRERGRLAALFQRLWQEARQQPGWRGPGWRTVRTWQAVVLAVVVARSTRLLALGQVLLVGGTRAAQTTKAVAVLERVALAAIVVGDRGLGRKELLIRLASRLLWAVALAYALLMVALHEGPLTLLREQAVALLRCLAAPGRHLTVGKLAEAIGLDYARHRRAWCAIWRT